MCGIFALIGTPHPNESTTRAILSSLAHRGPDGQGVWSDSKCWMAHTRLAIVAPQDGEQPLVAQDQDVALVVNGEFYEHRKIRQELEQRGARFMSGSDSEILLHLYRMDGLEQALAKLEGEFAFILWDKTKDTLILGRDRFGIKPLVYMTTAKGIAAASQVKTLQAFGERLRWDAKALAHSCHHQYIEPGETLFQGILQVPPGHTVTIKGGHAHPPKPYWSIGLGALPSPVDDRSGVERVCEAMERAVYKRLQGDVPITATLSGGLDSSVVVALAAEKRGLTETFGVSFGQDQRYDESAWAIKTASHLGLTHHVLNLSRDTLLNAMEDAVWGAEGLCINAHLPAKFLLSKAIKEAGYSVALTGEGSDELFLGYPHLEQEMTTDRLQHQDDTVQGVMVAAQSTKSWDTSYIQDALKHPPSWMVAKHQLGWRLRPYLTPESLKLTANAGFELRDVTHDTSRVRTSSGLWTKYALAQYILRTLGDGTEMPHAVEGRTPFLDRTLWEVAWGLDPAQFCIRDGVEKWVLRQAMQSRLPPDIIARKKHPFLALSIFGAITKYPRWIETLLDQSDQGFGWWNPVAVRDLTRRMGHMSAKELQLHEPVWMTIVSSLMLHKRFHMESMR